MSYQQTPEKYVIVLIDWNSSKNEYFLSRDNEWVYGRKQAKPFMSEEKAKEMAEMLRTTIRKSWFQTIHTESL